MIFTIQFGVFPPIFGNIQINISDSRSPNNLGIPNARLVPWTMLHVQWISLHLGSPERFVAWRPSRRFPWVVMVVGGVPKMVGFPNKPMGFPTKNDQHLGCEMGGKPTI